MTGVKLVELGGTGMVIVTSVEKGSTVVVDTRMGPTEIDDVELLVMTTGTEEVGKAEGVGVMMESEVGPTVRVDVLEAELGSTVTEELEEELEEVDMLVITGGINLVKLQCVKVFVDLLVIEEEVVVEGRVEVEEVDVLEVLDVLVDEEEEVEVVVLVLDELLEMDA